MLLQVYCFHLSIIQLWNKGYNKVNKWINCQKTNKYIMECEQCKLAICDFSKKKGPC